VGTRQERRPRNRVSRRPVRVITGTLNTGRRSATRGTGMYITHSSSTIKSTTALAISTSSHSRASGAREQQWPPRRHGTDTSVSWHLGCAVPCFGTKCRLHLQPRKYVKQKEHNLKQEDVSWDAMSCGSCKKRILEERIGSIIRVKRIGELRTTSAVKRPHGVTAQKTTFFIDTAMITSNLT
jgi:hypothetical protein